MNRTLSLISLAVVVLSLCACRPSMKDRLAQSLARADQQLSAQLETVTDSTQFPRTTKDGRLVTTRRNDWTEGFYPGCLWYMYELTGELIKENRRMTL